MYKLIGMILVFSFHFSSLAEDSNYDECVESYQDKIVIVDGADGDGFILPVIIGTEDVQLCRSIPLNIRGFTVCSVTSSQIPWHSSVFNNLCS